MALVQRFRQNPARSKHNLALLVALTLLASLGISVASPGDAAWANSSSASALSANSFESEVLRLTNVERTDRGLRPVTWSKELGGYARYWSEYMAFINTMRHGPNPWDSYPTGWQSASENVAAGFHNAASVVDGWMNSSGHRNNILNPAATHLGVGYATSESTPYWTQNFAQYPAGVNPDANPKPLRSLTSSTRPVIAGSPGLGVRLSVRPGQWDEFAVLNYQWRRANADIPGATGTSYTIQTADAGHPISVRVTGRKYGAVTRTLESLPVGGSPNGSGSDGSDGSDGPASNASKRAAQVRVKLAKKKIRRGKRAIVTVRVRSAGKPAQGKVAVRFGKKRIVRTLKNGRVRVKSPRLTKRGKVRVSVRYRGTKLIKAKRAPAVIVRVR